VRQIGLLAALGSRDRGQLLFAYLHEGLIEPRKLVLGQRLFLWLWHRSHTMAYGGCGVEVTGVGAACTVRHYDYGPAGAGVLSRCDFG
jgi:hypothetical protein